MFEILQLELLNGNLGSFTYYENTIPLTTVLDKGRPEEESKNKTNKWLVLIVLWVRSCEESHVSPFKLNVHSKLKTNGLS